MRIVCPICSATYEVKDTLLAPGRAVRCARCSEQWVPIPEAAPDASVTATEDGLEADEALAATPPREPAAATPRLTAMERLASHPVQTPPPPRGLGIAWAASIIALGLICWGLLTWRAELMHAWPPTARFYDLLGLVPHPAAPAR